MRLPPRAVRSTPVYAGWQLEQTSITISARVDRVVKVVPQVLQRTLASLNSGCSAFNRPSPLVSPILARQAPIPKRRRTARLPATRRFKRRERSIHSRSQRISRFSHVST
jgi:hypothetical protein